MMHTPQRNWIAGARPLNHRENLIVPLLFAPHLAAARYSDPNLRNTSLWACAALLLGALSGTSTRSSGLLDDAGSNASHLPPEYRPAR